LARTYRVTAVVRVVNRLSRTLARLGIGSSDTCLLTVTGRKTGVPHSTPVTLVQQDGGRWLVAPYGEMEWVKNARAAGRVTLTRAGRSKVVSVAELSAVDSAPVLRAYITKVAITRPYFDVRPDSPLEAFQAEAPRHPVFQIGAIAR
jgi:deazaflavin-dependent oxidoreductase (nitroreductase family)